MVNFDNYFYHIQLQNQFHTWGVVNLRRLHPNISCIRCYPPFETTEKFNRFWTWFTTEYPSAIAYTRNSQRYFRRLINLENPQHIWKTIAFLIFSIRFDSEPKPYDELRQDLYS
ncbi:11083_t:CDS:1 [Funneliformis geosporum]|uniref:11083_t:CDS:1 n=1 Tax=Funneliformis geosporum TaxID=1117311 RepID=A0A9W4WRM5_9GLOM|nr:11083_t:CDS:1 [Funneliformis geosporum]